MKTRCYQDFLSRIRVGPAGSRPWRRAALCLKATAALLPAAVLLLSAELAARRWTRARGDPLDRAGAVLRLDAELGWRQREGLESRFLDLPLRTDALGLRQPDPRDAADRSGAVLLLGPSSTFGWGVAEPDTYARRLEELLRKNVSSRPSPVINAGQIGFSTWQGLRFYERELRRLRPRVVGLAYGANDADRYRFFFQDRLPDSVALARSRSKLAVAISNGLRRWECFRLISRAAARFRGGRSCLPDGADARRDPPVPGLRVPIGEFVANLEAFANAARADGASVLMITTAFRLTEGDADVNEAQYRLSAAQASIGRCAEARAAFETARSVEPSRIARDLKIQNEAMRLLARRLRVSLIDAEYLLGREPSLFVDPIHPSAEGHRRIAEALSAAIRAAEPIKG